MSLTISTYVLTLTHLTPYQSAILSRPHLAAPLTARSATLSWPHVLAPPRSPFFFSGFISSQSCEFVFMISVFVFVTLKGKIINLKFVFGL